MAVGPRDLVFVRCGDLAQELTGRDLHFVVEGVVLSYHQAMVVPHSPLLLTLLGRASEKEQIVYLEGVTSEAVMALMEFIYTGTTIVTAKFASEVQKVQSILQFQVAVQSLILPPPGQVPRVIPTRTPDDPALRDERKRQMEVRTGEKPPKRRYTRRKDVIKAKIKRERIDSAEHEIEKENIIPESYEENGRSEPNSDVVKSIESRSDGHVGAGKKAEVVLPREGTKEYRAEYKKVRDRLWKRRVREGLAKPYIPKEEVEKEMRSPKNSKSDASDSEATTPYASNSEAETFSVTEGTISPATFPSIFKSVFPTKVNTFSDSEYQQQKSPQPSLPPLPRMLPMNNFKSEFLSPMTELASKLSEAATSPLELMPSTQSIASLAPGLPFSHPDIGHLPDPQNLPNRINQWIDDPQFMDTNFIYMNPSATPSPSNEATGGELEDAANNMGSNNININSNMDINKLGMPGSHSEDFASNANSADAWTRLPYNEEALPF